MYYYLNDKFNNSSKKVKIEIYLLTLLLCFSFILLSDKYLNIKSSKQVNTINKIPNIIFDKSFFDLIKEIETYSKKRKIEINEIENINKSLNIMGSASLVNVKKLIFKIENINKFSNIRTFYLNKDNKSKKYNFQLEVDFEKFFIKNKNIILKKESFKTKQHTNRFKVNAIISDEVLINNTWLKINEKIKGYSLININKNTVILKNKNEKIILKVFKDDKYSKLFN